MDGRFIIENLLRQEKNDRLDFMPKPTEDILAKKITAMLNARGGDIVVGVDDSKSVVGVSDSDMNGLSLTLANRINPSAPIDVHSIDYNGIKVLLLSVWEGSQKPFIPNRSLGPISSGDVKVFSCSPESKECLPLIYGSHKT